MMRRDPRREHKKIDAREADARAGLRRNPRRP